MKKINLFTILLFLLGALGLILLFLTPTASASIKIVQPAFSHDFKLAFNLAYNGSSVIIEKGMIAGVFTDIKDSIYGPEDYYIFPGVAPYPTNTFYMKIIGMATGAFGALLLIFSGIPIIAIFGGLIAIGGAVVCITANCLLLEFIGGWKTNIANSIILFITGNITGTAMAPTFNNLHTAWLGPVISCGLIIIGAFITSYIALSKRSKKRKKR